MPELSPAAAAGSAAEELLVRDDGAAGRVAIAARFVRLFPGGRPPSFDEVRALGGERIRDQRATKIDRVQIGDVDAIVKTYVYRGLDRLGTAFGRSQAECEVEGLLLLAAAGVAVPAPIGYAVRRRRGLVDSCIVIEERIADAEDLATWSKRLGPSAAERPPEVWIPVIEELARDLRRIHDAGLTQGKDAHLRNVFLRAEPAGGRQLVFLDTTSVRRQAGRALARGRARDLGRLTTKIASRFGEEGVRRFFDAYLREGVSAADRAALEAAVGRERRRFADETPVAFALYAARRVVREAFLLRSRGHRPRRNFGYVFRRLVKKGRAILGREDPDALQHGR